MRFACLFTIILVSAEPQKGKPPLLSKKATEQLKAITDKITETPGEVIEPKEGEFVQTKLTTKGTSTETYESDFADKRIIVKVHWRSTPQQSKIYPSKEEAAKAKDWLKPGQVAGKQLPNVVGGIGTAHVATYYYMNGEFVLDEIRWSGNSTANGDISKWSAVIGEPAKKRKE